MPWKATVFTRATNVTPPASWHTLLYAECGRTARDGGMSSLTHAWSDCRRGWPGCDSGNYPGKQVRIAVPTNESALSDFPCMVIAGSGENLWTGLPAMRNLT